MTGTTKWDYVKPILFRITHVMVIMFRLVVAFFTRQARRSWYPFFNYSFINNCSRSEFFRVESFVSLVQSFFKGFAFLGFKPFLSPLGGFFSSPLGMSIFFKSISFGFPASLSMRPFSITFIVTRCAWRYISIPCPFIFLESYNQFSFKTFSTYFCFHALHCTDNNCKCQR